MTMRARAARTVAALPPALRWRARNTIALARWLRLRAGGADRQTAYADDFWALHASGDWNGLAEIVLRCCAPRSLVDVGCGDGKLLAALRGRDGTLPLLGIDSSRPALERAAAAGVEVEWHELSSTRGRRQLRERVAQFDVAVSLETVNGLTATRALWAEYLVGRFGLGVTVEHVPATTWARASVPPRWGVLAPTPLPSGEAMRPWPDAMAHYAPLLERAWRRP